MNKWIITIAFIACLTIAFLAGVTYGAHQTIILGISIAENALDVTLSERAKDILINNPEVVNHALEFGVGYDNPFINHHHQSAAPKFEYCMLTTGDYDGCYDSIIARYGPINDIDLKGGVG